jgi:hypothetical protein
LQGAAVLEAAEDAAEVEGIVEPHSPPDFSHRPLGVLEEVQGPAHAGPEDVGDRRVPCTCPENPTEVAFTAAESVRQIRQV